MQCTPVRAPPWPDWRAHRNHGPPLQARSHPHPLFVCVACDALPGTARQRQISRWKHPRLPKGVGDRVPGHLVPDLPPAPATPDPIRRGWALLSHATALWIWGGQRVGSGTGVLPIESGRPSLSSAGARPGPGCPERVPSSGVPHGMPHGRLTSSGHAVAVAKMHHCAGHLKEALLLMADVMAGGLGMHESRTWTDACMRLF